MPSSSKFLLRALQYHYYVAPVGIKSKILICSREILINSLEKKKATPSKGSYLNVHVFVWFVTTDLTPEARRQFHIR